MDELNDSRQRCYSPPLTTAVAEKVTVPRQVFNPLDQNGVLDRQDHSKVHGDYSVLHCAAAEQRLNMLCACCSQWVRMTTSISQG